MVSKVPHDSHGGTYKATSSVPDGLPLANLASVKIRFCLLDTRTTLASAPVPEKVKMLDCTLTRLATHGRQ